MFEVARLKPDTYVAEVGNKIGAELLKPHLVLCAGAEKYRRARLGFRARAHYRRWHSGQPAARAAQRRESANRSGVLARSANLQISCQARKNRREELLQSFNMGVGMILVVPPAHVKFVEADLKKRREKFFRIGRIERSDSGKARVAYSGALAL